MKYIIVAKSSHIINKFINTIKEKHNIVEDNYFSYDYSDKESFNNVFTQYMSANIFNDSKMIVLRSSSFINEVKLNKIMQANLEDISKLESNNVLVFVADKFNKTNSQRKNLEPLFKTLFQEEPKGKELNIFIENWFDKYQISYNRSVIKNIIDKTDGSFELLVNELKKLSLLNEKISNELVEKVIYDYKGETIFALIDGLINKNSDKIKLTLNSLRGKGLNAVSLFEYLINEITLILQIKNHLNNPNAEYSKIKRDLSQSLGLNLFRLMKLIENGKKWNTKEMIILINKLNVLNIQAKSSSSTEKELWSEKKILNMIIE